MVAEINAYMARARRAHQAQHFASVWSNVFTEDQPLRDLLFAMMRDRGIHILDNFPCFLTTAHTR